MDEIISFTKRLFVKSLSAKTDDHRCLNKSCNNGWQQTLKPTKLTCQRKTFPQYIQRYISPSENFEYSYLLIAIWVAVDVVRQNLGEF